MATILLSAAGAAIGSGFGGTVLGLSGAVIGRAVGATIGRVIDQRLLGAGSESVESGRVDRFRLMGASEGAAVGAGLRAGPGRRAGDLGDAVSGERDADVGRWRQGRAEARDSRRELFLFGQPGGCAVRRRDPARRPDLGGWGARSRRDSLNLRVYSGQ